MATTISSPMLDQRKDDAPTVTRAYLHLEDAICDTLGRELPELHGWRRREIASRIAARACESIAESHDLEALAWRIEAECAAENAATCARMQR